MFTLGEVSHQIRNLTILKLPCHSSLTCGKTLRRKRWRERERETERHREMPDQLHAIHPSPNTKYRTEEALLNIPTPPDTTCGRSKEPSLQVEPRPWPCNFSGAVSTISCHLSTPAETSVIMMQK